MNAPANRGKKPEDAVKKYLEAYDARTHKFDWHRNYDAHTAGGRFPRQVGDFEFYLPGIHGVIEVKEVNHLCRLPHKNFTLEAVAKLRKRSHASGHVSVLIYFTPVDQWRILGLTPFFSREGGSWDLGLYKLHPTAPAALDSLGLFL
jgi:hypothetical protein